MNRRFFSLTVLVLYILGFQHIYGQTSVSNNLVAQPIPDRDITFNIDDAGVSKPIIWGLDLAWLDEANIRRGIAFMGANNVDVVRASFQPTLALVNGDLQTPQINDLNTRLNLIALTGSKTKVVLNCDHPSVNAWYSGNAVRWAQLIDATTRRVQERNRIVVSVSPFNEPDYTQTGQGTITDFFNIAGELRKNSRFDSIRISGGNTLNCDKAIGWYNTLKTRLDEGNTHQLAGSFDSYANFFTTVRANGDHATNDELHNVMEAMVGVEYGMQTGIWWGTAEYARSEFVKTSDGKRLAYAEHRPNWTAASVYRSPEGKIQAFGGTSERQAVTTSYRFISQGKDLFFDGHGPQREYTMVLPGGTGYQQGQSNAEQVVNITWGDDIQPIINGRYTIVNRKSGKVMEVAGGSANAGANVRQYNSTGATYQQWDVKPVDPLIGGDFSYFSFTAVHSGKAPDILNWSLEDGGNIIVWDDAKGVNQQWYLEYAEDGWFYIRSRFSSKCLEVASGATSSGANIQQWRKDGDTNQQWRFIPVGAKVEFIAPTAPADLKATANAESIRLDWTASPEDDVDSYTIFRTETRGAALSTIAKGVKTTSFVDNTTTMGGSYYYTVKAIDKSLNRSDYTDLVYATATGDNDLVAHLKFEGNTLDSTINLNHGSGYSTSSYAVGKVGSKAISLSGSKSFVQLPTNVANQQEITIATWVYWRGGANWQRIFDFGNGTSQYFYLSPRTDSGKLRFAIKNGGDEASLNATALPTGKWSHVAITMSNSGVKMYVNGLVVDESDAIGIRPIDFKPALNYIGRSQYSDPLYYGFVDDFRVYNYALSTNEIGVLAGIITSNTVNELTDNTNISLWPIPAYDQLHVGIPTVDGNGISTLSVYNMFGKLVITKEVENSDDIPVNLSNLSSGMYTLYVNTNNQTSAHKFIVLN